jgi:hypothetical protein
VTRLEETRRNNRRPLCKNLIDSTDDEQCASRSKESDGFRVSP